MLLLWYSVMVFHAACVGLQLKGAMAIEPLIYALVNVFRSMLPRLDGQRICMFDTWASTPIVGRALATISEISFAFQIQRHTRLPLIIPSIVYAQVFCWLGLLTGRQQFHVVEETIWAIMAIRVMFYCMRRGHKTPAILAAVYACYMLFVDIPMYASRQSRPVVSIWQGVQEISACKVDLDWSIWREDAVWMTGYFIGATQISIFLN